MDLWQTRLKATKSLEGSLQAHKSALDEGFAVIDTNITALTQTDSPFSRASALTAIKARNLALGSYSLVLDGLAQEAGALLRPLLEALELLTFFRLDPQRIDLALEGRLPKAGEIARQVEGQFKELRQYLNDHASHFSFTYKSLRHVLDFRDLTLRVSQRHNDEVLLSNLTRLTLFLEMLVIETFSCRSHARALQEEDLEKRVQAYRDLNTEVFFQGKRDSGRPPE